MLSNWRDAIHCVLRCLLCDCRLCPTYATDINSPLRHVRTRIYFTSESHVHSLINVLRFCQLGASPLSCLGLLCADPTPNSKTLQDLLLQACPAWHGAVAGLRVPQAQAHISTGSGCCRIEWHRSNIRRSPAGKEAKGGGGKPLVSQQAQEALRETPELDYLTHIVMRLYENKQ